MPTLAQQFAAYNYDPADAVDSGPQQDAIGRAHDALILLQEVMAGTEGAPPERVALGRLARVIHHHGVGREELFEAAGRLQADPIERGSVADTLHAAFELCDGLGL